MSRCFPYPPPGFEKKSGALDHALINSIKLQKKGEKAKKERKKEKKREKGGVEEKQHKHEKRHKNGRNKVELEGGEHRRREEAEQFEKSGLTEEHGQPVSSQNLCDSPDSTQNSHKRKKHCSPSSSNHNLGSILRIRLKRKDQEILPNKETCSNSGKIDNILLGKNEIPLKLHQEELYSTSGRQHQCSTSGSSEDLSCSKLSKAGPILSVKYEISPRLTEVQTCSTLERATVLQERCENNPRRIEEQVCSTSGLMGIQALEIGESFRRSSRKVKKIASQYRDLIENWVPHVIDNSQPDSDDQDWLFQRKSNSDPVAKKLKPSNDGVCERSSSLWPRACYLPEADMYALPYTVPF